jgi:hypothetical protein
VACDKQTVAPQRHSNDHRNPKGDNHCAPRGIASRCR